MQVLERWGFARVLALTVEEIEGKEHQAMSGLVDGRAQGIEIGQELDAETSARSLLKQQIFGTVEQRRATISQLYGLGPKGRGWGQRPREVPPLGAREKPRALARVLAGHP